MGLASIKTRVKKAQSVEKCGDYSHILELIKNGAYYDEISEEEKAQYKAYKESWGAGAEDIAGAELAALYLDMIDPAPFHFQLTPRRKPPTPEELKKRVEEVEEIIQKDIEEYNSPEAIAERERERLERAKEAERRRAIDRPKANTDNPGKLKIEETNILYLSKKPTEQTNDGIIRKEL